MAEPPGALLADILPSWELSLSERDLSPRYIEICQRTGRQLLAWLRAEGLPADTEGIDAPHLRAFLAAEARRTSAISAHQHYRNLRVLFKWLAKEDERKSPDPMIRVEPPKVTKKIKPIFDAGDLAALLRTCDGATFAHRRDTAIIRILADTGVRVSGVAGIRLRYADEKTGELKTDVSLPHKTLIVTLKGGDEHPIPVGRKAVAAIDRYMRVRARHKHADSDWLWLGTGGRHPDHFGSAGIQDMLERRGKQAGIGKITPHWFRRWAAHAMLEAGMQEMDVARVGGWKSTAMVRVYAGELAGQRARQAHARLSPGDRI